jgi:hypothetical protein
VVTGLSPGMTEALPLGSFVVPFPGAGIFSGGPTGTAGEPPPGTGGKVQLPAPPQGASQQPLCPNRDRSLLSSPGPEPQPCLSTPQPSQPPQGAAVVNPWKTW